MNLEEKAKLISQSIQEWLHANGKNEAKPSDVMDYLIFKGIYKKDYKNGKPLRDDLRKLFVMNKIHLIDGIEVEHKRKNKYWTFRKI